MTTAAILILLGIIAGELFIIVALLAAIGAKLGRDQ